jgi:DivIVA domain-containing protein
MEMLIVLVVLVGIALVAVGRGGALREDDPDRVDTRVPAPGEQVLPESVDAIRFGLAFRGYRMDEVDDALDRLRDEIAVLRAHRDTPAATLTTASAAVQEPAPAAAPDPMGQPYPAPIPQPASRFAPIDGPSVWAPPPTPPPSAPAPAAWQPEPAPELDPEETDSEPVLDAAAVPEEEPELDATPAEEPSTPPSWAQWAPATAPLETMPEPAAPLDVEPPPAAPTAAEAWALDPLHAAHPGPEAAELEPAELEPAELEPAEPEAAADETTTGEPAPVEPADEAPVDQTAELDDADLAESAEVTQDEAGGPIAWEREEPAAELRPATVQQPAVTDESQPPAAPAWGTLPPDEPPRA